MKKTVSTKRPIHCSHCGQTGHNRLKCPITQKTSFDTEDDEDGFDDDELLDFGDAPCNEDMGLCPHGSTDDEGCEEPGCYGGSAGFEPY